MQIDSLQLESLYKLSNFQSTSAIIPDAVSPPTISLPVVPMEVDPVTPLSLQTTTETPDSRSTEHTAIVLLLKLISRVDGSLQPFSKFVQMLLDPSFSTEASGAMDESNRVKTQGEEAWVNMQRWREMVSRDLKSLQEIHHTVTTSQRIAARFFDIAESLPAGQTPTDLPAFLSAMKFVLYLAVKMEAVKEGCVLPDIPVEVTEEEMVTAFNAARNSYLKAKQSDAPISWKELVSDAWSTMPADSVSIKAFYLGMADHLNAPIDPITGMMQSAAESITMKRCYLNQDNREELDLFSLYSGALLDLRDTITVLDRPVL